MRTIERATAFKRDYRKAKADPRHSRDIEALLTEILALLVADLPLPERYRDHPLSDQWNGYRDCLDRLARSVPDARAIADALIERRVKLALGASVYDPADPMGKIFFNILPTFAEFEADLIRMRTREGMAIARAKGKLRGKQPKLSDKQQKELHRTHDTGEYSISDLTEVFSISRPTEPLDTP